MSDITTHPTSGAERTASPAERVRRLSWPTAAAVLLVGSAFTIYGAHDLREVVVVLAVLAAVVAAVYGWLLPSRLRSGRVATPGLVLSVVAVVLIPPAFWSALPLALGAAGALLGHAGRTGRAGTGRATAALVLGVLAVVAYLATYAAEALGV